ncbi:hypothetical protein LJ656_31135 [Paraburkholderia sp. MMS20-SJTR3]|uniref:Uncharacterized protein n=1 Tax=Paraburkholderia sejongensis TaxID=2886946 RepID=A0ABS8K4X7_9BURK|nr:hypothetical protein [Paraburkholderia sp. MMS20-SJTR3]MCC8397035.1 hypothetical protein [Paraburkholderia sp. MMS20-SJTR3]
MDIELELKALAKAEEDLRHADERILRQEHLTEEMRRDGHDISIALDLLLVLQETREAMLDHRELIVANLTRMMGQRRRL